MPRYFDKLRKANPLHIKSNPCVLNSLAADNGGYFCLNLPNTFCSFLCSSDNRVTSFRDLIHDQDEEEEEEEGQR